jgi:serine/threonine protein kinase
MKDYFFKVEEGECVLHIVMEYMDTSLYALIKGQRQLKQPVPLPFRKIMAFQLFKALYYLQVSIPKT